MDRQHAIHHVALSVERWGRHLALKNNGKVDASNGDDMPTQINVAT
ncbi:MAG: hypothetical protein IT378_22060, partial [Sandaracinaceae bacterium]|nr:hypothetical protein [Sandaracinaceae bacterium]